MTIKKVIDKKEVFMIPENAFSLPTRGAVIDSRETAEKPGGRYLKVLGRIRPVDPEAPDICFQVNLPEEWNRRLLHFGGGGFDGFLVTGEDKAPWQNEGELPPVLQGYITCGSDSGHSASAPWDGSFALNDEALRNFAHEHIKKVLDAAVFLVGEYYGEKPEKCFFAGSSNGGRAALKAVIHYPEAYDGVISMFPVLNWVEKAVKDAANATYLENTQWKGSIDADSYKYVTETILSLLGDENGFITGTFDSSKAELVKDALRKFLSTEQMEALEQFACKMQFPYPLFGDVTEVPGYAVFYGEPLVESFVTHFGTAEKRNGVMAQFGDATVRYQIMQDPSFDPRTLDLRKHRERIQAASRLLDATEADIRPFVKNGGKLMLLHGMMDQVVTPYGTVDYYRRAAEKLGEAETEDALRLYLVPNYGHGIGEHYNMTADLLGVLEDWVLKDIRPEEIHSSDRFPKENGGSYGLKPYRVQVETAETL